MSTPASALDRRFHSLFLYTQPLCIECVPNPPHPAVWWFNTCSLCTGHRPDPSNQLLNHRLKFIQFGIEIEATMRFGPMMRVLKPYLALNISKNIDLRILCLSKIIGYCRIRLCQFNSLLIEAKSWFVILAGYFFMKWKRLVQSSFCHRKSAVELN